MLDGSDTGTFYALRLLRDVVDKRQKPVLIWVGAGVGKWCGYPDWQEAAEHFFRRYSKLEPSFNRPEAQGLLRDTKFPELFEACKRTNARRYNQELASLFSLRRPTSVFSRFTEIVTRIAPLQIITTNVDEALERNLPAVDTDLTGDFCTR